MEPQPGRHSSKTWTSMYVTTDSRSFEAVPAVDQSGVVPYSLNSSRSSECLTSTSTSSARYTPGIGASNAGCKIYPTPDTM